jgi:cellobiose phosphorylase
MPAIFPAGSSALGIIRNLASRNDDYAIAIMALLNNTYYVSMTFGAEATGGAAANTVRVSGQITDQDGQKVAGVKNVLITSVPVSGAGTMTAVAAHGTMLAGTTTKQAWIQTLADGSFQVDVLNAAAETNLITAHSDNGTTEMVVLTYV